MSPLEKICFSFIPTEKRGFLPHRKPPSSEGSASVPGPQYLRRMHGMHRHRIQTSHRDCLPPPRSVPGAPESGRSWPNFHLHTDACRTVHKIPVWMAGFQKNGRSAVCHCKSDPLNLLRYSRIIQRNCHFKIHAQFLIHGID